MVIEMLPLETSLLFDAELKVRFGFLLQTGFSNFFSIAIDITQL